MGRVSLYYSIERVNHATLPDLQLSGPKALAAVQVNYAAARNSTLVSANLFGSPKNLLLGAQDEVEHGRRGKQRQKIGPGGVAEVREVIPEEEEIRKLRKKKRVGRRKRGSSSSSEEDLRGASSSEEEEVVGKDKKRGKPRRGGRGRGSASSLSSSQSPTKSASTSPQKGGLKSVADSPVKDAILGSDAPVSLLKVDLQKQNRKIGLFRIKTEFFAGYRRPDPGMKLPSIGLSGASPFGSPGKPAAGNEEGPLQGSSEEKEGVGALNLFGGKRSNGSDQGVGADAPPEGRPEDAEHTPQQASKPKDRDDELLQLLQSSKDLNSTNGLIAQYLLQKKMRQKKRKSRKKRRSGREKKRRRGRRHSSSEDFSSSSSDGGESDRSVGSAILQTLLQQKRKNSLEFHETAKIHARAEPIEFVQLQKLLPGTTSKNASPGKNIASGPPAGSAGALGVPAAGAVGVGVSPTQLPKKPPRALSEEYLNSSLITDFQNLNVDMMRGQGDFKNNRDSAAFDPMEYARFVWGSKIVCVIICRLVYYDAVLLLVLYAWQHWRHV